jgi:hypothetical protein
MENSTECVVHGRKFVRGEMTDQVTESFGADSGGLLDQDAGCLS